MIKTTKHIINIIILSYIIKYKIAKLLYINIICKGWENKFEQHNYSKSWNIRKYFLMNQIKPHNNLSLLILSKVDIYVSDTGILAEQGICADGIFQKLLRKATCSV